MSGAYHAAAPCVDAKMTECVRTAQCAGRKWMEGRMLRITIEVDGVPAGMELAVKEDLAMKVEEWYGKTVRVVKVEGVEP